MNIEQALNSFPNLHDLAQREAAGPIYDSQQSLVKQYRASRSRFMALMPLRHRYHCPLCNKSEGEVIMYLEDPQQPNTSSDSNPMWPNPVGRCATIKASILHAATAHSKALPAPFAEFLNEARA